MQCVNHPQEVAVARCSACAESFCANCLVPIDGNQYCGSCKVTAVQGPPVLEENSIPCKEAKEALIYAIVGLFCFGIILGPLAIHRALKAKKMIAENPRLTGSGKATAGLIVGILALIFNVFGIITTISNAGAN